MTNRIRIILAALIGAFLFALPVSAPSATAVPADCESDLHYYQAKTAELQAEVVEMDAALAAGRAALSATEGRLAAEQQTTEQLRDKVAAKDRRIEKLKALLGR